MKRNQKGFTLIEVVLVLAIGGLIFLLAFLAFTQTQTNRRDTQRRTDLNRVSAEMQNYAADKNGAFPTSDSQFDSFLTDYMSGTKDPSSNNAYTRVASLGTTAGQIKYTYWATAGTGTATAANTFCDGVTLNKAKSWKAEMKLEKGTACVDNN